jgi:hypothetical protein
MFDLWGLWTGGRTELQHQDGEADTIVGRVLKLYAELSQVEDLRPCTAVNISFGDLVEISTRTIKHEVTEKVLSNPKILTILPSLRRLCAESEYLLESYWVEKIIGNEKDGHEQAGW